MRSVLLLAYKPMEGNFEEVVGGTGLGSTGLGYLWSSPTCHQPASPFTAKGCALGALNWIQEMKP